MKCWIARAGPSLFLLMLAGQLWAGIPTTQPAPGISPEPARVVITSDPHATTAFKPDEQRVSMLMEKAILRHTGRAILADAWQAVAASNDVVGIKVFSAPGPNSGTRPALVAAVVRGLIAGGVPAKSIIIWDRDYDDLRTAGFVELARELGVRAESTRGAGYDGKVFYDSPLMGNLVWSDFEFGQKGEQVGRKSYVTKLVTKDITKIISVTPLLNHNIAGVAGHLFGLAFGSVDNTIRFEREREALNQSVPEIYALSALGDKVVLNITDALVCQYQGGERSLLHYSAALNEIRLSKDPVALDVLSVEELERQRQLAGIPQLKVNQELFDNAALLQLGESDSKKIRIERVD